MYSLELNANSLLRALTVYTGNPNSDTKFQLQRRASDFVRAVIEHGVRLVVLTTHLQSKPSSGKSLPPMAEFLQICNYFDITPSQFFDESEENPALLQTAIEELRKLNDDDLMLIIGNIRRLTRE